MIKTATVPKHPDWYRASNPAKMDLQDVTNESSNPMLGIMRITIIPPSDVSYLISTAEIHLVGATVSVGVYQSRASHACFYLEAPVGVSLNMKVKAQVLRYMEKEIEDRFSK